MPKDYFTENGFEIIESFLTEDELLELSRDLEPLSLASRSGGIRNIEKKSKVVNAVVLSSRVLREASNYLDEPVKFVRAILFDKTPLNNWFVAWHQDKTVSVSHKFVQEGWEPWSVKDGVLHVQPPETVLNQMVTFRIHLEDSNLENGCLKIIPNSHSQGLLSQCSIKEFVDSCESINCDVKRGSAIVMRPHLLHSSSKAIAPSRRPVLHLEFSSYELPEGVGWA